jgi:hypothetical protein
MKAVVPKNSLVTRVPRGWIMLGLMVSSWAVVAAGWKLARHALRRS